MRQQINPNRSRQKRSTCMCKRVKSKCAMLLRTTMDKKLPMLAAPMCMALLVFVKVGVIRAQRDSSSGECALSLPIRDDKLQPIFLTRPKGSDYELAIPEDGKLAVSVGDSLYLLCSPSKNYLIETNEQLSSATCSGRRRFEILGHQTNLNETNCKSVIRGQVFPTNKGCGEDGKIYKLGLSITVREKIFSVEVCHDNTQGNTFYSQHVIYGQSIAYSSRQKFRPAFQDDGFTRSSRVKDAYKRNNQVITLSNLLGSHSQAERFISPEVYLVRGHLAPDADFLYAGLQYVTYFYLNVCPQWNVVNSGNWLSLEKRVRRYARTHKSTLKVLTGTYGVLQLPDEDGGLQEIFLGEDSTIPVPKFVWKILYNEETEEGIVFVILNDPYVKNVESEDILCEDVCRQFGWSSTAWHDKSRGYVYCCDIRDFKKVVGSIPKFNVKKIIHS